MTERTPDQPAPGPASAAVAPEIQRVSTLELFLDLVFVFTVTQLSDLIAHPHGLADYARAALVLALTWWIYSGYAWLTSNVAAESLRQRLLMFAGMLGFLLMALAIPSVMTGGGLLYGSGYLLVTVVHAWLFKQATTSSARAIVLIAPFNLVAALLLLLAGLLPLPWVWAAWALALASVISSGFFRRESGFTLSPAHFVERHGLVIIVALGESIVSIGSGARNLPAGLELAVLAGLALALAAGLWWSYFGGSGVSGEDARAERALLSAATEDRPRLALYGFGVGHLLMIGGIMALAAGIKLAISHPLSPVEPSAAWNLAGGLALYLLGDLLFRTVIGSGARWLRGLVAVLALPTVLVGTSLGGGVQLLACVVLLLGLLLAEARSTARMPGAAVLPRA